MSARVVILRGRTSDRTPGAGAGAQALGGAARRRAAGRREPEPPRARASPTTCATRATRSPPRASGSRRRSTRASCRCCSRRTARSAWRRCRRSRGASPRRAFVWLDAHGDFNTPATTGSGFLGGMCLAAACGRWDSGFGAGLDPRRVVMSDGRDLDPPSARRSTARASASSRPRAWRTRCAASACSCISTSTSSTRRVMPAEFPAPGGLAADEVRALLAGSSARPSCRRRGHRVRGAGEDAAERGWSDMLEPLIP